MARAHPIAMDLQLADDRVIDLFVFQWSTPLSGFSPLSTAVVDRRRAFLQTFADWFRSSFSSTTPNRLCMVLMPELSLPLSLQSEIDGLVASASRPLVVIGGLEFLSWQTYLELLSALPLMPSPGDWALGGAPHLYVNTAMVWIRDRAGRLLKFLQPKRNPSNPEDSSVFRCEQVLLFQSTDQTSGRRVNFCVQICSDFTSVEAVSALRRCCEEVAPGSSLDFTFVLQWNENQEAGQFKHGAKAYFSEPLGLVNTAQGCLVFVNNANTSNGKSANWGRSKFHFCYTQRWVPSAPLPTCSLQDHGEYGYQAAVLREPGPAVYWLRYKPHYLVSRMPGSGQTGPFFESFAECSTASTEVFDPNRFTPLLPVLHWLEGEWRAGASAFRSLLVDSLVASVAVAQIAGIYDASVTEWLSSLRASTPMAAGRSMSTYFEAHDRVGYPRASMEPATWQDAASRGAQKFQYVFTLLQVAASTQPLLKVRPDPGEVRHASGEGGLCLTLLWGGGEKTSHALVSQYLNSLTTRAHAEMTASRLVLVLVEPVGLSDPRELTELLRKAHGEFTQSETTSDTPPHLQPPGNVVNPLVEQRVFCLSDQHLIARAAGAQTLADLEARLASTMGSLLL